MIVVASAIKFPSLKSKLPYERLEVFYWSIPLFAEV